MAPSETPAQPVVAATPEEVKSFRAQQEEEWGQYVALVPITYNGANAYAPGDPVPASNVKKHGYGDDLVAKTNSSAAKRLVSSLVEAAGAEPIDLGNPVTLSAKVQ